MRKIQDPHQEMQENRDDSDQWNIAHLSDGRRMDRPLNLPPLCSLSLSYDATNWYESSVTSLARILQLDDCIEIVSVRECMRVVVEFALFVVEE